MIKIFRKIIYRYYLLKYYKFFKKEGLPLSLADFILDEAIRKVEENE